MAQASQSSNPRPVRPPPPPGYYDADATPSPAAVKPPPPPGYFDADLSPSSEGAKPEHQTIDVLAEPRVQKPAKPGWSPLDRDELHNLVQEGMRWGAVPGPTSIDSRMRRAGQSGGVKGVLSEPLVKYDESVNLPHDPETEQYLADLKAKDKRPPAATNGVELANRGIARGARKMVEGLTTPANLGIGAATAGLGAVPGVAGNTLRALVSGYFTEEMLRDAYHTVPEIKAAADAGDTEKLAELLTKTGGNLAMAAGAGTHAASEVLTGARGAVASLPARGEVEPEVLQSSDTANAERFVNRGTIKPEVQPMQRVAGSEPTVLPEMQGGVHAGVAENAPDESVAEVQRQREKLRQGVPVTREAETATVSSVRGEGRDEASRLQQTAPGRVAVPQTPETSGLIPPRETVNAEIPNAAPKVAVQAQVPVQARPEAPQAEIVTPKPEPPPGFFDVDAAPIKQDVAPVGNSEVIKQPPAGSKISEEIPSQGRYAPVEGAGSVVKVPLSEIGTDSARFQPRRGLNAGRVEAIRANMERSGEFGDKFPLDVWRDPQTGRLNMLAGHHRLEAAKAAGLSEVTARLHDDLTAEQAADFARRSNSQAAPMSAIENARAYRAEMDRGRPAAEVAKEYGGITSNKVEDLARLTTLPPELQDHIQDGVLTPEMGIALAKAGERNNLPSELLAEVYDKIIKTTELTPTELGRMVDTLAPAAAKQMKMGLGFELPTGFMDPLNEYLGKIRELNGQRNAMRRYANEVARMERTGQKVSKTELSARDQAVRRVEKLQAEVAKMEKSLGRGKLPSAQAAMREPAVLAELKPSSPEAAQPVTIQREQGGPVLPGMEPVVQAEQEAAGRVQAEKLTEKSNTPTSIEEAAGNMERESPLFRNSGAGGQSTLYSNPIPQLMRAWSDGTGKAAWDWIEQSVVRALPEKLREAFVTNYGLPPEYVGARREASIQTAAGYETAERTGARMADDLTQEQQQALGRFFKGEATEADILGLRNDDRWNDAVEATKQARSLTDDIGFQAVMQNLLKDETFFRNQGKYMPRLYRKWEVDYDAVAKDYGGAPTRLDLQRFKARTDIPESVRLQMGEILEPAYPFAKGYAQMVHDVELQKLFKFVADRPEWAATDLDTLFTAGKDQADYVQMPETKKLGPLSGKWVQRHIADDINQMVQSKTAWQKFSGNLLGEWKFGKVVISPATHARNMMSNTILNQLGGLPMTRVDMYYKALRELAKEGPAFQEAKAAGLVRGTFNKAELGAMLDAWNRAPGGSLADRFHAMLGDFKEGRPLSAVGVGPTSKLGQKVGNVYQSEELWFKMAKILHNREQGMSMKDAVDDAHHWLFDYSEVPKYVSWARKSPFGSPFITFTSKALPRIAESLVRAPWRAGAVAATIYAANNIAASQLGLDKEDLRRIEAVKPDRMRETMPGVQKYMLLPWKDKYGQLQYLDLTYILPWGDIGETQVQALQGFPAQPLLPGVTSPVKSLFEVAINHSSFTDKPIFKETDTSAEKSVKVADYLWKTVAPTLAPGGYGFERIEKAVTRKPDYFGRVSSIPTAAASTLAGVKVQPLDPQREGVYREHEAESVLRELDAEARSINRSQARSPEEKQRELASLRDKAARFRKEQAKRYQGEPQVQAGGR